MRILYFHQHFSTPSGSTGTRSYEFAKRLVDAGHEVTMVCGSAASANTGLDGEARGGVREGAVDGIRVIEIVAPYSNYDSLLKRSLTFLKFAWRSVLVAARNPYDLLFATSTPLTAGIPGIAMRLLKPSRKFVFEVRDLWPELPKAMGVIRNPLMLGAMSALEWLSYHCATACVGLSPGIREGIRRRGRKRAPVAMIPNGCDLDLFRPRDDAPDADGAELAQLGIPATGLRAVFTGAHGMANGLDAVLDAAAALKRRGRGDIHLVFIGDGRLKPALTERARDEGLDNCLFLDPVPKFRLASLLRRLDTGMMILANVPAFYYGTSPNKFFDYIASGLPVLNNYPGWLTDLITEHDCGVAVPPDDPDAFADGLERLADDPDARERMGRNARRLAETRFSRERLAREFIDFIEQAAAGKAQETP